jgi:hypothetical protein
MDTLWILGTVVFGLASGISFILLHRSSQDNKTSQQALHQKDAELQLQSTAFEQERTKIENSLDTALKEKAELSAKLERESASFEQERTELRSSLNSALKEKVELQAKLETERLSFEQEKGKQQASLTVVHQENSELRASLATTQQALESRKAQLCTSISSAGLEVILKSIPQALEARIDADGDGAFKFMDQDKDLVTVIVSGANSDRLSSMFGVNMPSDYFLASLMAANAWNQRKDAHGTFAYAGKVKDRPILLLESHLQLANGIELQNVKAWLENFIKNVNPFESSIASTVKDLDTDSKLLKGSGGFWRGLGSFFGGVLEGAAEVWLAS